MSGTRAHYDSRRPRVIPTTTTAGNSSDQYHAVRARSETVWQLEKPQIERDALRRSEWTAQAIRRNWNESRDRIKAVLRYLAEHPELPIQKEELALAVCGSADAASLRTLRSTLAAFGNRTTHRYGFETWPFSAEGGYCMLGWVAEIIRGLRD